MKAQNFLACRLFRPSDSEGPKQFTGAFNLASLKSLYGFFKTFLVVLQSARSVFRIVFLIFEI